MDVSLLIRLIDQASAPAKKIADSLRGIGTVAGEMKRGFGEAIRQGFSVENIDEATRNAEQALSNARGRLLGAVGLAMTLAAPVIQSGKFDQSMRGLDKVLDVTHSRLQQLRKFALETSAMVPIAAASVVELMSEAAQGGVPEAELEAFSLYVARAAVAFDMAGGVIGERFAKLRNVYKLNQEGIEDLGDATNHLSNNMAAKASELTDFTNRAAGAAKILKLSATEITAVGAAMIAAGIAPETAARGFSALSSRVLTGGKKIDAAFKSIGMNRKAFLKELESDAPAAIQKLFSTMATTPKGMEALIELVGQDFADDFAKFLANPELLAQAFQLIADKAAYAGSATDEAAKMGAGAEKRWELLINKLNRLAIITGDKLLPAMLQLADGIGDTLDSISAFADANPELAAGAVKVVAALLALNIAGRLLSFGIAAMRLPLIKIASTFLKFDKSGRNIATGWRLMSGAARGLATPIWFMAGALQELARHIPALRRAAVGFAMLAAVSRGGAIGAGFTVLASAIGVVGSALAAITAPIWGVVAALAIGAGALWKYWDRVSSFVAGFVSVFGSLFDQLATYAAGLGDQFLDWTAKAFGIPPEKIEAYKAAARAAFAKVFDFSPLIDGIKEKLSAFWDWMGSIFSQEKLSGAEQAEMYAAGQRLGQSIVDGIRDLINSVKDLFKFALSIEWPEPPEWVKWIIDGHREAAGATKKKVSSWVGDLEGWLNGNENEPGAGPKVEKVVSDISGGGVTSNSSGGMVSDLMANARSLLGIGDDLERGAQRGGDAVAKGGEDAGSAISRGAAELLSALQSGAALIARAAANASKPPAGGGTANAINNMKTGSFSGGTE